MYGSSLKFPTCMGYTSLKRTHKVQYFELRYCTVLADITEGGRLSKCHKFPVWNSSACFVSAWSAISWLCPCGTSKTFSFKMSPKTDPETRSRVEALLPLFTSSKKLLENLQKSGKTVTLSTVERFRREKKMEAQGWKKTPRKLPKHLQPHQDRKSHIKKIVKWIDPKNPLTISEMARHLAISS